MPKPRDDRALDLAKIHMAKAQLAMDDDVYRDTVRAIANQRTSTAKDLDYAERAKLLEHFRRLGWKDRGYTPAKRVAEQKQKLMDKLHAQLAAAQRQWAYADGMARRMFKIQKVDWLNAEQLRKLVAAMEYDRRRREAKLAAEQPEAPRA